MHILHTAEELAAWRQTFTSEGSTVGFVPTMGALHSGHLSLVEAALKENNTGIVSIFVNPTQFNQASDLARYPRTPEADLALLESSGIHAVWMPTVATIYPKGPRSNHYALGTLETTMEGLHRPGHFQGVATVVQRLFELVQPHTAYFGEKDFQQIAVIRKMLQLTGQTIAIKAMPTLREPNGLAMSSRNARLSPEARSQASLIFEALQRAAHSTPALSPAEVIAQAEHQLAANPSFEPEYVAIADETTLAEASAWAAMPRPRMFCAVWTEGVRLIDNHPLY
jgi:pantoate--beta-alanine ligase